jgi:hypothetical protein
VAAPALEQQLVVHGQVADLGSHRSDFLAAVIGQPTLQGGLAVGQELVAPAGEGGGGDAQLAGEEFQALAEEEAEMVAAFRRAEERPRSPGFGVLAMGVGSWGLDPDDVPIGCSTELGGGGQHASGRDHGEDASMGYFG